MTDDRPLLSIVIANYNYGKFLETAIQSVLCQSCQDFELIVIDGGSSDNSVEVIKRHAARISYWISEKDHGQSDAFNKGFRKAHGRFLTWLNADDILLPNAVQGLKDAVAKYPKQEWFACGSVHFDPELKIILCARTRRFSEYEASHGTICVYSPSTFFTKELFDRAGGMDEFFHFKMDTDLWGRFYLRENVRFQVIPGYAFGFRYHDGSKTTCVHFADTRSAEKIQRDKAQGDAENARIRAMFGNPRTMSRLGRMVRMDWWAKLGSLIDTLRFRGKHLKEWSIYAGSV